MPFDTLISIVREIKGFEVASKVKIPGILVIDTPGHQAFMNLRKRGGSIADFAILVIDVTSGVMPQTVESVNILKSRNTPFVVAANKIDLVKGWKQVNTLSFLESLKFQEPSVRKALEEKIYQLVGQLSNLQIDTDIFYNMKSFKGRVPIVPVSAKTGEGIAELIAVIVGMVQTFNLDSLRISSNRGKGVVLEVTEETGLGTTLNVIVYDGEFKVGNQIALLGADGPIVTKIRSLLVPKPLDEMRDPRDKFNYVEVVKASAGVKVSAPNLEKALAGSEVIVFSGEEEKPLLDQLSKETSQFLFEKEVEGLVIKADTLGALEAIVSELQARKIGIRVAGIGPVSKKDVIQASLASSEKRYLRAILAFNVNITDEAEIGARDMDVKIFSGEIIYSIIEDYIAWKEQIEKSSLEATISSVQMPCKILVLPGFVFRRSKPAIFGIRVEKGILRQGAYLMNEKGEHVGVVESIRLKDETVREATVKQEVSISVREAVVGRSIKEGEVLYSDIPSSHAFLLKNKLQQFISQDTLEALEEIYNIKRKKEPYWGMY
ncbi:MAG: translation initiation factor IF-2 [Candidatus Brockarchaeota archaeon]|nr:translation initiation factor IF-2 [Candidatus Brockarchaeota archaeon]